MHEKGELCKVEHYGSHTSVVITLLTREALDKIWVAVDTGLSRSVLSAAVFSYAVSVNKDSRRQEAMV